MMTCDFCGKGNRGTIVVEPMRVLIGTVEIDRFDCCDSGCVENAMDAIQQAIQGLKKKPE